MLRSMPQTRLSRHEETWQTAGQRQQARRRFQHIARRPREPTADQAASRHAPLPEQPPYP